MGLYARVRECKWVDESIANMVYVDVCMVITSVYRDVFKCMMVLCPHVLQGIRMCARVPGMY